MHAMLHLITRKKLTVDEIGEIMDPYYEGTVFIYDSEKDEYIEPDPYPPFRWDYWRLHTEVMWEKPEDCFVLIDPDGTVMVRRWWSGKKHVNNTKSFERFVQKHRHNWKGCYMYELDIHW